MNDLIYFDEGTTSWPKDDATLQALIDGATTPGSSGRGVSIGPDRKLAHARGTLARELGVADASNIIFTPGATFGLNFVLKGALSAGQTVLVSVSEHNAVLRPLDELAKSGVNVVFMESDHAGRVNPRWVSEYLASGAPVDVIACQHASNVTGLLQPVEELCALGAQYDIPVIVDGAQAGGHLPIALDELRPAAWVCSGHKGFRGVKGVGVVYLREEFKPRPLVSGGTGYGEEFIGALERPESYEAGTHPLPAIMALAAAIEAEPRSRAEIHEREMALTRRFIEEARAIAGMTVLGSVDEAPRVPIVSVIAHQHTPDELAFILRRKYGIATRPGMQCAPKLHKYLGTFERGGAVRLSFSHRTTDEDMTRALNALREACS